MPRNVEIKARIGNRESLLATVAALADSGPAEICQDDTFIPVAHQLLDRLGVARENLVAGAQVNLPAALPA